MAEETKYDNRQSVLIFIAGVAMCAAFFVFGLLVGRWSAGESDRPALGGSQLQDSATGTLPVGADTGASVRKSAPPGPPAVAGGRQGATTTEEKDESAVPEEPERPLLDDRTVGPRAYLVRAATFSKSDDAETFAATLRSRGFGNAHARPEGGPRKSYWVIFGPYTNREDASRVALELRNNGVSNVQIISER